MTEAPASDQPAIALADTLDEARLRQVFPGAPTDLAVPRDVGSMFRARLRGLGGARRTLLIVAWVLLLAAAGGMVLGGHAFGGVALGVTILVVTLGVVLWQHSKASKEFFAAYARARGLTLTEDARESAAVPLFGRGDKREWTRVLRGAIAGQQASIAHYTYTDVSTDSEGNRTESDHDFTTLSLSLPAAVANRFVGVSLAPRSWSLGALQDALSHDRKVELESAEFARRYHLRVVDEQDDIALYELFSTTFVHTLATELEVYWEQRGGDLVVWRSGHETGAAELDRMCLEAWHVLHRYLQEDR